MSEFALADDSGLVTVSALAALLGVSDQTVYNYAARGMTPAGKNADGETVWDPAKARAWAAENVTQRRKAVGGRREGAGRKAKSQRAKGPKDQSGVAFSRATADRPEAGPTGASGAAVSEHAATQLGLAHLFREAQSKLEEMGVPPEVARRAGDIDVILTAAKEGRLTVAQVELFTEAVKAETELLKLHKTSGTLVNIDEITSEFGQHLMTVRLALEALPARVAPEVVAAMKLPAETMATVKSLVDRGVRQVMRELEMKPREGSPSANRIGAAEKTKIGL